MPATKSQPVSIDDIVVAHRRRARELVLAYARGDEVSSEEFFDIAQQSGKGVYWLQSLAETVAKGKRERELSRQIENEETTCCNRGASTRRTPWAGPLQPARGIFTTGARRAASLRGSSLGAGSGGG